MKIVIVLLALVAYAAAVEEFQPVASNFALGDIVKKIIEDQRDQMPCGFPNKGIPPLAPFELTHQSIAFDSENYNISGSVDDFVLIGLNEFVIPVMKISLVTNKATFRFDFKKIEFDTLYDLNAFLKKAGVSVIIKGNGQSRFALKDIEINGVVKFSYLPKLKIKNIDIRTKIGDVESEIEGILGQGKINRSLNKVIEQFVKEGVNSKEDLIANEIEELLLPKLNAFLADKKISDIIGGGGSGGEKVPCNPSK